MTRLWMGRTTPRLTPEEEADHLLRIFGGEGHLSSCLEFLRNQFNVIQARSQLLLTLATIALTITGFSGPKIAQSGPFARYSMAIGIAFVLAALVFLLLGGLRIHWISQFLTKDSRQVLVNIIRHRDTRTRVYVIVLTLLVVGLANYVASVVFYLLVST
jgi:hypothetical protein